MAERSRALVVAVGRFAPSTEPDEEPADDAPARPPLDFAYELAPSVAASLRGLGYEVHTELDPDNRRLRELLDGLSRSEYQVVQVISHGEVSERGDTNRLYMVPSCGVTDRNTNVSDWVADAQERRTPVLFLLDLCRAGTAARLPFITRLAGQDTRAWVIAGSGADAAAYDGRFSQALSRVLSRVARTGLGAHPIRAYVSFSVVARHIGRELAAMGGYEQRVHATPLDPAFTEPELPFFPNPRHVADRGQSVVQELEAPLRVFVDDAVQLGVDETVDVAHFLDRAGVHFIGRRAQLRCLAPWLDDAEQGGLHVVTGNPGVGKSALLGALVCAAHPVISEVVPQVRARLAAQDPLGCPSSHETLAAVHARRRDFGELMDSLGRQLNLKRPETGWAPGDLVAAVAELPGPPPVIVDALDEAEAPVASMRRLLLPLAEGRRADGRPVCRLLVGMRPWEQFRPLLRLAAEQGRLVDLDMDVSDEELHEDLRAHLLSRLAHLAAYRAPERLKVRTVLAQAAAARLAEPVSGRRDWGAFLVASVFVRLVDSLPPVTDEEQARALGARVPHTLAEVLELDMRIRGQDGARLRAVLAALAHAKGDGMPAEVAGPLAQAFRPDVHPDDTERLLESGRFYLRTGMDHEGTTVYRLFHQGLADYLCQLPVNPEVQA